MNSRMEKGGPSKKELRKFAIIAFFFFGLLAALQFRHHRMTAVYIFTFLSAWGLVASTTLPVLIRPLHAVLTRVAHAIGWFNTRLLLGVMFYLIFTPLGVLMRLFGHDLLRQKVDRNVKTYWITREEKPFDKEHYKRQF